MNFASSYYQHGRPMWGREGESVRVKFPDLPNRYKRSQEGCAHQKYEGDSGEIVAENLSRN